MTRKVTVDGTDVTEPVQIMYDIVHSSMDWGSGLLDNEEMETVIRFAILMGFNVPDMPYNGGEPLATIAQKFPEHYKVEWITTEAHRGITGYEYPSRTYPKITVIQKEH